MERSAQEQLERYVTYTGLALSPVALIVSYVLVDAQGFEKALFSPLGICAILTIGPALLRSFGQSPFLIIALAVLNLAKPNKSTGVYLTPQGILFLTATCFGSYYLICDMLARTLVSSHVGRLAGASETAATTVADPGRSSEADVGAPRPTTATQQKAS
jgi:hypothetical protein